MVKIISIIVFMLLLVSLSSYALIDSCTLNNPRSSQYDNGLIKLNATAIWSLAGMNVTNVTFTIGTTVYSNFTVNGSKTNTTAAGVTVGAGDFTFTVATANSDGSYTAYATCFNTTNAAANSSGVNSSSITYVIDTLNPSIALNNPNNGENYIPIDGIVTFFYTPGDTNLGNASIYINGAPNSKATSDTTAPNITGNVQNNFKVQLSTTGATTWIIEITDLAGRKTNSSTRTVNVVTASQAGQPIVTSGGGVTTGGVLTTKVPISSSSSSSNVGIIVVIVLVILGYRYFKRR